MKLQRILFLALAGLLLGGMTVRAELCGDCQKKMFIMSMGTCPVCGAPTTSGSFKLCKTCSAKQGKCQACLKPLAVPALPAVPPVAVTESDNSKTITIAKDGKLEVTLPGNITTGYSWKMTGLEGDSIKPTGHPQYLPNPAPAGRVGTGGQFVFKFNAAKPGTAKLTLAYARPWEKDTPPAQTFTLTVVVQE